MVVLAFSLAQVKGFILKNDSEEKNDVNVKEYGCFPWIFNPGNNFNQEINITKFEKFVFYLKDTFYVINFQVVP